jgi:outer membrane protein assembly factor BamB
LWSYTIGKGFDNASPVVADGVLYIGSDAVTLYAFDLNGTASRASWQPPELQTLVPNLQLKARVQ